MKRIIHIQMANGGVALNKQSEIIMGMHNVSHPIWIY